MRNLFVRVHRYLADRIRLRRICKRLGINPFPWQRRFALGLDDQLEAQPGRQTGKTTAVMLRLLMMRKADYFEASKVLYCDPDFSNGFVSRCDWYSQEYRRLSELCGEKPLLDFRRFALFGKIRHG